MKGVVFTEFLEMVEETFSPETADQIIEAARVDGAYTSVGTYEACELGRLVQCLGQATETPVSTLLKKFGEHMFTRFLDGYPALFEGVEDAIPLLERVDDHIHVEVRKLYPDAELPKFRTSRDANDEFILEYQSERPLADLAHGLISGCVRHFGDRYTIKRTDRDDTGHRACFVLESR